MLTPISFVSRVGRPQELPGPSLQTSGSGSLPLLSLALASVDFESSAGEFSLANRLILLNNRQRCDRESALQGSKAQPHQADISDNVARRENQASLSISQFRPPLRDDEGRVLVRPD